MSEDLVSNLLEFVSDVVVLHVHGFAHFADDVYPIFQDVEFGTESAVQSVTGIGAE